MIQVMVLLTCNFRNENTDTDIFLGFKPSEFAIINGDSAGEFEREKKLTLSDKEGRQLNLRLNY